MIYGYTHRCEKSVSFFGYVKERSYPKGYNRRYVLLKGACNRHVLLLTDIFYCYYIRIYCRWCVPYFICFYIISLFSAPATYMDVNGRGSPSTSVRAPIRDKLRLKRTSLDKLIRYHCILGNPHRRRYTHRIYRLQCR